MAGLARRLSLPPTLLPGGDQPSWHEILFRDGVLKPLSSLYGTVVVARRRWWMRRAESLSCPVASVGNLTCGGTGKTPTVEMVARDLLAMGRRPAVLSRGYRSRPVPESRATDARSLGEGEHRRSSQRAGRIPPDGEEGAAGERAVNDEYLVLEANLPQVPHYQGPDRASNGRTAIRAGADVLVLDDGFQHVRLRRNLDLVLVDALRPFDNGRLLPAGLLREPLETLENAHLVAITRTELAPWGALRDLALFLTRCFPRLPQVQMETRPTGWEDLSGRQEELDVLCGEPVLAFCGVGNPESFRRQLQKLGVIVREWVSFRDHYYYRAQDLERLARRAGEVGAAAVVMTQKDAVKLRPASLREAIGQLPWRYLRIRQTVRSGSEIYRESLERLVAAKPTI